MTLAPCSPLSPFIRSCLALREHVVKRQRGLAPVPYSPSLPAVFVCQVAKAVLPGDPDYIQ